MILLWIYIISRLFPWITAFLTKLLNFIDVLSLPGCNMYYVFFKLLILSSSVSEGHYSFCYPSEETRFSILLFLTPLFCQSQICSVTCASKYFVFSFLLILVIFLILHLELWSLSLLVSLSTCPITLNIFPIQKSHWLPETTVGLFYTLR